MKNLTKKMIALVVAFSMVLTLVPKTVDAASYTNKVTKTITVYAGETMKLNLYSKAKGKMKINVKVVNDVRYAEFYMVPPNQDWVPFSDTLKNSTFNKKTSIKKGKNEILIISGYGDTLKVKLTITTSKKTIKLGKVYRQKEEYNPVGRRR
ncbi:hypothetical protein [Velocimicrobium porci]|uniref:Uncharacterized protein n=1 Tax=Velocimicrobium porci TaxID=2606634 RepID=A0A6L5XUU6_9FIRM|nr:hypothetical protein [Velocimicrobium porci]MSS62379.1 hypothetical protein [Velocimicrobium porci]